MVLQLPQLQVCESAVRTIDTIAIFDFNVVFLVCTCMQLLPLNQSCSIQPLPSPFILHICQSDPEATVGHLSCGLLIIIYQATYRQLPTPEIHPQTCTVH